MIGSATDVFVSYKAEDRARLAPLVEALETEGFIVWWDARIGGGANWQEEIEQHLDGAKCVIVAWSKLTIGHDGHFVRDEARRAQKRGAYVPICFDGVEPPLGFGEIQALSLKGWKGDRSDPRFRALADAVRSHTSGVPISHAYAHFREPRVTRRAVVAGSVGGAIVAVGVGGWLLLKPEAANAKRIAVLPFANLSGAGDQAYFAEGIAEELRSALSRIGMEVIGRASSHLVKDLDTKSAADKLGVANILTGSVRRSPEVIRINAQLVGGKDGVERWAQSYDRAPGDAIIIQTDIAENVARALSIALGQSGRAALTLGGTTDSVAQDLFLQSRQLGRQADSAEALHQRIALAEKAIARDPRYANAYVEKAIAVASLATNYATSPEQSTQLLADAEAAARKATTLSPELGPAHAALGLCALSLLNFPEAFRHNKRALALAAEDTDVLSNAARDSLYLAGSSDGLRVIDRAIALDPLNGRLYRVKAEVLLRSARDYRQAIEFGRKALELAPEVRNTHIYVGDALLLLGQPDRAKAEYGALPPDSGFRLTREAIVAVRTGESDGARRMIAQVQRQLGAVFSYQYAEVYAQLGDKDRAFAELNNAINTKDPGLLYLRADPFIDPIRGDPRYDALLKRLNFPS